MFPTSREVLPLLSDVGPSVWKAVRAGVESANSIQPDPATRDNHFWSHCARFYNKQALSVSTQHAERWTLKPDIPNTGIHLIVDHVHNVRILKSLNRMTPPPGGNRARRAAWSQMPGQTSLFLTADNRLLLDEDDALPAMSLIIDWYLDKDMEPRVFVGLPLAPWAYAQDVRLHWRVALPGSEEEFAGLSFDPKKPDDTDFGTLVKVDETELGKTS